MQPDIDDIILLGTKLKDQQILNRLITDRNFSGIVGDEKHPKLQRIVVGQYGLGIETSGNTYFSNYFGRGYKPDIVDFYNFVDNSTGEQITNIYPTSAYFLQSAIFSNTVSESDEFLDEYLPNAYQGFTHIAQVGDSMVAIGPLTNQYKQTRLIPNTSDIFENIPLSTMNFEYLKDFETLCPYVAVYATSAYHEEAFDPMFALSGIYYNYLIDVQLENSKKRINRYDGIMYSMHGNMKNFYDANWNTSGQVTVTPSGTIDIVSEATLKDTRFYRNINADHNDFWVSYTFGNDYTLAEPTPCTPVNSPSLTSTTRTSYLSTTEIPMKIDSSIPKNDAHAYEHIERIKGFNIFGQENLSKSNLFSIRINNSNLNQRITDKAERKQIQTSINNIMTKCIDRLAIASTQLFKIYWTGY